MLLLFLGVAIVQSHETSESSVDPASQNRLVGFSAVIISCLFSGFAGVYLEKILKSGHVSIWLRNIQLSMFASILAACGMAAKDGREIAEKVMFTLVAIKTSNIYKFQLYLGNILRFQRNCICSGLEPGLRGPPDRSRHQVRRQYCEGIRHKYRHHRLHCHVRRLLRLPDSGTVHYHVLLNRMVQIRG